MLINVLQTDSSNYLSVTGDIPMNYMMIAMDGGISDEVSFIRVGAGK